MTVTDFCVTQKILRYSLEQMFRYLSIVFVVSKNTLPRPLVPLFCSIIIKKLKVNSKVPIFILVGIFRAVIKIYSTHKKVSKPFRVGAIVEGEVILNVSLKLQVK